MNGTYNVFIVNNDDSELEMLKESLKAKGYIVDTVTEGQSALKRLMDQKYHIVLIHLELKEMDGIQLLKEIKKYDPLAQIIAMSSQSTMDKIIAALEYGANDYVHMPVDLEIIAQLIDDSIRKLERWRKAMIYLIQ